MGAQQANKAKIAPVIYQRIFFTYKRRIKMHQSRFDYVHSQEHHG